MKIKMTNHEKNDINISDEAKRIVLKYKDRIEEAYTKGKSTLEILEEIYKERNETVPDAISQISFMVMGIIRGKGETTIPKESKNVPKGKSMEDLAKLAKHTHGNKYGEWLDKNDK